MNLFRRLRHWTNRARFERELDEEMRLHIDLRAEEWGDGDAARRGFGNTTLLKEASREMWSVSLALSALWQDLRHGFRIHAKSAGFTLTAVMTLALGIGATTAVFSVVDGILIRPLPYAKADRIAMLWRIAPIGAGFAPEDFPWGRIDFNEFSKATTAFESLGAILPDTFTLTGSGEPVFVEGVRTSAGFFQAMGVSAAQGRVFTAQEDRPGFEHEAVLGDRMWREQFGADRAILGRSINLNGFVYTVIGVMPPGFTFPHGTEMPSSLEFPTQAELWVPLAIPPGAGGASDLAVVGRMKPGVTISQAQTDLDAFAVSLVRAHPNFKDWNRSRAVPLEKQIVGDTQRPLVLLLGAVGLVLLIACSNVAGLVLTRSLGRRREFRLRAALGAGSGRLVRQLLAESLLLAAAGGIVGIALAEAGVVFVRQFGPENLPRLQEVTLDLPVLAFCTAISLLTGILFGLAPAIGAGSEHLAASLKAGGPRIAAAQLAPKLRGGLLIGQVALALMLVVAAGLLARTFSSLLNSDGGFKVERVLTFEISLPSSKYSDPARMAALYHRALDTLRTLPGVESAGMVHAVPMGGAPDATGIRIPDHTAARPDEKLFANYMFASSGYFATVHTPLLRGREFLDSDTLDATPVTVVNRAMADAFWPGQQVVGKQVGVGDRRFPLRTIIGVVANVKQASLREVTAPEMYVPYSQNEIKVWPPMGTMQVALRAVMDPAQMTASVRQAIRSVDPDLPLAKVATLGSLVDRSLTQPRFAMLLMAAFGILALILASIGMYGVISHSVSQRTQEIGIRIALGAQRANVFAMVLGQGAWLAAAGIAAGLLGALLVTRAMESFLFGVRPLDPLTFGAVSLLLAAVALLACYLPARRATRVDPMVALRHE